METQIIRAVSTVLIYQVEHTMGLLFNVIYQYMYCFENRYDAYLSYKRSKSIRYVKSFSGVSYSSAYSFYLPCIVVIEVLAFLPVVTGVLFSR